MNKEMPINNEAVLLCRISSAKQAEGFSLDFQERCGKEYAERMTLKITHTPFRIIESASKDGRVEWEKFIAYLESGRETHILIPKVDRALRNFRDMALISEIARVHHKTFHFFHDGIIYHKDSPAATLLNLGIQGSMATWYSADLAQKTKRGLEEKIKQGELPGRAPTGYINDKPTRKIVLDPVISPWVVRIKKLSATGLYSLKRISEKLEQEGAPKKFHTSNIEHIIRNPFYHGWFISNGKLWKGSHETIITKELHDAAVAGLERFNKPKLKKREFIYNGLISCGTCNRAIFGEEKKQKYRLYHCSGRLPCTHMYYVREEELTTQFENTIRGTQLDAGLADEIIKRLSKEAAKEMTKKTLQIATLKAECTKLDTRISNAYDDLYATKDPAMADDPLMQKIDAWKAKKADIEIHIARLESLTPDHYMHTAKDLLELSKNAFSLYRIMEPDKKREFLRNLCSNYILTNKKLDFTYRKPFDIFAEGSILKLPSGTRTRT